MYLVMGCAGRYSSVSQLKPTKVSKIVVSGHIIVVGPADDINRRIMSADEVHGFSVGSNRRNCRGVWGVIPISSRGNYTNTAMLNVERGRPRQTFKPLIGSLFRPLAEEDDGHSFDLQCGRFAVVPELHLILYYLPNLNFALLIFKLDFTKHEIWPLVSNELIPRLRYSVLCGYSTLLCRPRLHGGLIQHMLRLPDTKSHHIDLVAHSLPLSVRKIAVYAQGRKGQNFKGEGEPLKHPMTAKVLPKPFGYMLFICGLITATIGMACACLLLPRSENGWAFCGYLVCGIVFLWLTIVIIYRSLDIIYQC